MNGIEFSCPAGHKVRAKSEYAGKMARCPKCNTVVRIPGPQDKMFCGRNALTQSGVMRILGDASMPTSVPEFEGSNRVARHCPRCNKQLPHALTVCAHCQLYVGADTSANN